MRPILKLLFLLPAFLCCSARLPAGNGTDLAGLKTGAGALTPAFAADVTGYAQMSRSPDLLLWPTAADVEAIMEVRANGGAWSRTAPGPGLVAGSSFALAIRANGTVAAWGESDYGLLNVPAALTGVVALSATNEHALALKKDGTVAGWGMEQAGELTGVRTAAGVTAILAHYYSSYTVHADGTVRKWGTGGLPLPAGISGVVALQAFGNYVIAQRRHAPPLAWTYTGLDAAFFPAGAETAVAVDADYVYSRHFLLADGSIVQSAGFSNTPSPPVPAGLRGVVKIHGTTGLKHDGTLVYWGDYTGRTPQPPAGLASVADIAGYEDYIMAVKHDGSVVVWGDVADVARLAVPAGLVARTIPAARSVSLQPGANTVDVRLTAPGGAAKTYTIAVDRTANADLRVLEPERGTLAPAFSPAGTAYSVSLPFANDSIRFRLLADADDSTVTVNGGAQGQGVFTPSLPLVPGGNTFTISVTAAGGATQRSYAVNVTRQPPQTNAALRHLAHMAGPLTPAFSAGQLSYTHSTPYRRPRLALWPRAAQVSARVEVRTNGGAFHALAPGRQSGAPVAPTVIQPDGMPIAWTGPDNRLLPLPPGVAACAALNSGDTHTALLRTDGVVIPWEMFGTRLAPPPASAINVVEVAATNQIIAALRSDGTVIAWNAGIGTLRSTFNGVTDIISLSAAQDHFAALRRDGSVILRSATVITPLTPPPAEASDAVAVYSTMFQTTVLRRDGTLFSWRHNNGGAGPVIPPGLNELVEGSAGGLALRADSSLLTWDTLNTFPVPPVLVQGTGYVSTGGGVLPFRSDGVPVPYAFSGAPGFTVPAGITTRGLPQAAVQHLDIGPNRVDIRVTAENGAAQTYTLDLVRAADLDLASLTPGWSAFSPPLGAAVNEYALIVPWSHAFITLAATTVDDTVRMTLAGEPLTAAQVRSVPLSTGENVVLLQLTAEDGITARTVTLRVTREALHPPVLRSLDTNSRTLTPQFAPDVRDYSETMQRPGYTVWPRAAGSVLEARTGTGAWLPLSTGPVIAGGSYSSSGTPVFYLVLVRPDATVDVIFPGGFGDSALLPPAGLTDVISVAAGRGHALALKADGSVVSWGLPDSPARFSLPLTRVAAISSGPDYSYALHTDGRVTCRDLTAGNIIAPPAAVADIVALAAPGSGGYCTMIRADGLLLAWNPLNSFVFSIGGAANGLKAVALAHSTAESHALLENGSVVKWSKTYTSSGHGVYFQSSYPVPAAVDCVALGNNRALRRDGAIIDLSSGAVTTTTPPPATVEGSYGISAGGGIMEGNNALPQWGTVPVRPSFLSLHLPQGPTEITLRYGISTLREETNLTVTRVPHVNLAGITVSTGALSPAFSPAVSSYSLTINQTAVRLGATAVNATARVELRAGNSGNWTLLTTAAPTVNFPLPLGDSTVTIRVTEPDDTASSVTTVTVTRVPNPSLTALSLSTGALAPAFSAGVSGYTASVPFATERLRLRFTTLEPGATATVNGQPFTSDGIIPLVPGENVLTLMITSEDGATTAAITLRITREAPSSDPSLVLLADSAGLIPRPHIRAQRSYSGTTTASTFIVHAKPARLNTRLEFRRGAEAWRPLETGQVIAAGTSHALGIRPDGTLAAWGANNYGQTVVPEGLDSVVSIAAGSDHSLALRKDGSVVAWGNNTSAQCNVPAGLNRVRFIAAGGSFSIVVQEDGLIRSWGSSNAQFTPSRPPVVAALYQSTASQLLALGDDGVAVRPQGNFFTASHPAREKLVAMTTGGVTFLRSDGRLFLSNYILNSQPGVSDAAHLPAGGGVFLRANGSAARAGSLTQELPATWSGLVAVAGGGSSANYGLRADGSLIFEGDASLQPPANLLLRAAPPFISGPLQPGLNTVEVRAIAEDGVTTEITALQFNRAPLTGSATLAALGSSSTAPMSGFTPERTAYTISTTAPRLTFWPRVQQPGAQLHYRQGDGAWTELNPTGAPQFAVNSQRVLARRADGTLRTWGLGLTLPFQTHPVAAIAAGDDFFMALMPDATVVAWTSTTNNNWRNVPELPPLSSIAAGRNHCLAVSTTGTVHTWGSSSSSLNVPAGLPPIARVAGGNTHTLALSRDGRVFSWGSQAQSTVPANLPPVVAIAAGDDLSAILKQDGTVAAWGVNTYGQATVPAGLSGVVAIACGGRHVLALKSDGTVVSWGDNRSAQSAVPAGLSGVVAISAGGSASAALRSNGTLAVWGVNTNGITSIPAGLTLSGASAFFSADVAAGSSAISLRVTAPEETLTYSLAVRSYLNAYNAWAATAFPAGTTAFGRQPQNDTDFDGILNGIEYLTGSNPGQPGPSPLSILHGADGTVEITCPHLPGIPPGLETVESAADPAGPWLPVPAGAVTVANNLLTVRLPAVAGRLFVRLRAEF